MVVLDDDCVRCRFAGPGLSTVEDDARFFGDSELMLTVTSSQSLASWLRLPRGCEWSFAGQKIWASSRHSEDCWQEDVQMRRVEMALTSRGAWFSELGKLAVWPELSQRERPGRSGAPDNRD